MWDARVNPKLKVRPLIATRSLHDHARRRKRWNRGFSTASVKGYEPIITRRAMQLVQELEKRCGGIDGGNGKQPLDLAQWFSFFTYVHLHVLLCAINDWVLVSTLWAIWHSVEDSS